MNIEDHLWLVDFLREWDESSFFHLAVIDEFFVYIMWRPNFQNDRIWSLTPDEIPDEECHRELIKSPECVGVFFFLFIAWQMMWVIKPQGQNWDADYFREKIFTKHIITFLQDPQNVLDITQVTFLHDKAPSMKALQTQNFLKNNIDFFGSEEWPGNSPDLNACENVGIHLGGQG